MPRCPGRVHRQGQLVRGPAKLISRVVELGCGALGVSQGLDGSVPFRVELDFTSDLG